MKKSEEKILRYIKRNPNVARKKLLKKFPNFDKEKRYLHGLYYVEDLEEVYYEESCCSEMEEVDSSKYFLSREGEIYFEQKHEKLLLFWLPYSITTAIAIASLIAQFLT